MIVYGSLYPWTFRANPGIANPFFAVLTSHSADLSRRFIADIVINVGLYVPVGFTGYLAFNRFRSAASRLSSALLLGVALSACMEMLQLYVPTRRPSVIDLATNTAGTILGIFVGLLLETAAERRLGNVRLRAIDRSAAVLLAVWVGALTFPLFPVMQFAYFRYKLAQMHSPSFDGLEFLSAVASWYAVGLMLEVFSAPKFWIWVSVVLIPVQFLISSRLPSISATLGAVAGAAIVSSFGYRGAASYLFLGVIVIRALWPFHISPAHEFSFLPFGGFLKMHWQPGIQVLLEKSWYFGAAIWLLTRQFTAARAACLVVLVAAISEVCQIFLRGRTAEITDPILALLMALALWALRLHSPARRAA